MMFPVIPPTPLYGLKGSFDKILGSVALKRLTLKALITTTADDTLKCFVFQRKIRHFMGTVCLAAIHRKCQVLFSLKNNKINFRMSYVTNLLSALMVSYCLNNNISRPSKYK